MRPETTADRLNQKVLVWSPETPAHDTRALAANIDRVAISNLLLSAIESFTNIVFGMRVSRREGEALVTGFLFNISGNVGMSGRAIQQCHHILASGLVNGVLKGNG
jgi:hypothetical protein